MAQPQRKRSNSVAFNLIELLKNQTLGMGSYGAVYKAKCDDLLCAAKILHPTLMCNVASHQQAGPQRKHRLPFSRFQQECEFMSAIRHPNIVQYLGSCEDPETRLPVLIMELMDDSLTHFLEVSKEPLPYHIQINFCHDITQALSFLHSNGIIHRDLSSNNVLLIGDVRAKVTDFGMAKLGDVNPQGTRVSNTMCPGTDAYMPPEAVKEKPVHTVKIDSFSFGVLVIQILTRRFPEPGDRFERVRFDHPQIPNGWVQTIIPEIQRRKKHISQVDPNHPLQPIALLCLEDKEIDRPTAQDLCATVAAFKKTSMYRESVKVAKEASKKEKKLMKELQEKDEIIAAKDHEIQQLKRKSFQRIEDLQQVITAKQHEIGQLLQVDQTGKEEIQEKVEQLNQQVRKQRDHYDDKIRLMEEKQMLQVQLKASEEVIAQFQTRIQQLEAQVNKADHKLFRSIFDSDSHLLATSTSAKSKRNLIRESEESKKKPLSHFRLGKGISKSTELLDAICQENVKVGTKVEHEMTSSYDEFRKSPHAAVGTEYKENIKLRWKEAKTASCFKLSRHADAVVEDDIVYLTDSDTQRIYGYNFKEDTWAKLPDCFAASCSLAIVNNILTTIGGKHGDDVINQLFSLTGYGPHRKWTEVYSPMPTKRHSTIAVCSVQALVVAGGYHESQGYTAIVEILNIETRQWSTAAHLPCPIRQGSAVICGDRIYMLGGWSNPTTPIKSVYTCSVDTLLQCSQKTALARLKNTFSSSEHDPTWSEVAELPVTMSTCITLYGRFLAVGGLDPDGNTTNATHMYNPNTNNWEVISHMTIPRRLCLAAALSNNKVMVVGGYTTMFGNETDHVEIATVI